jgi:hypothetical protein
MMQGKYSRGQKICVLLSEEQHIHPGSDSIVHEVGTEQAVSKIQKYILNHIQ